jgi:hypothetical protein
MTYVASHALPYNGSGSSNNITHCACQVRGNEASTSQEDWLGSSGQIARTSDLNHEMPIQRRQDPREREEGCPKLRLISVSMKIYRQVWETYVCAHRR